MSLHSLIKDHQAAQLKLKESNERKKKRATESMQHLSNELVLQTNKDTVEIFRNQQALESEAKQLHQQTQKFGQKSQQWMNSFAQLNDCLKELGDVQNWAQMINDDVEQVVKSVDCIIKRSHQQQQPLQQSQQQESS